MPESSAATTKPNEIGTGTSGLLQATPGVLVSEPPQPYFQSWSIPGTGCEDLGQHLPCISNGVPQASEKYIVRFDQPVPMATVSAEIPYRVVSQPLVDGDHTLANSFIPMDGADANQTKPEPMCQNNRLRRSNRTVAMTRNDQVERATLRLNLDLPCPLSEVANHTPHIPVRDMCAWVDRPVETRHQEALQRHGRIPRPMNSFMLYRLAYSDRAKYWLAHDDHQAISILTGRSWKMEPPNIRKQYKTLAVIEKQKHAGAHPEYRFSPSNKKKRSRTARARSQKLVLRLEAFPKVSRTSQPHAGSTSLNNDRVSGPSTEPFLADEETLIQTNPSNPAVFGSLQSAASMWWQEIIYSQMASAGQVSAGTQPCVPVVTGQPGIPDSSCFVPQSGCPGLEAGNEARVCVLSNDFQETMSAPKAIGPHFPADDGSPRPHHQCWLGDWMQNLLDLDRGEFKTTSVDPGDAFGERIKLCQGPLMAGEIVQGHLSKRRGKLAVGVCARQSVRQYVRDAVQPQTGADIKLFDFDLEPCRTWAAPCRDNDAVTNLAQSDHQKWVASRIIEGNPEMQ
ncbi:hypothetical protein AKAW_11178 [Aspergillus luchuensis IFO 4308]|nr:hypothetical protein AKAW_11178 [Aspergillus luchuensis IFO 4308]